MMRQQFLNPKNRKHSSSFCDGLHADVAVKLLRNAAKHLSHFNDGDLEMNKSETLGPNDHTFRYSFQNDTGFGGIGMDN